MMIMMGMLLQIRVQLMTIKYDGNDDDNDETVVSD